MNKLSNYFSAITYFTLGYFSSLMPIKIRVLLGNLIGDFLRLLSSKRKNITLDNIEHAFPDKSGKEQINIMKESYRNLGITLLETTALGFMPKSKLKKLLKFENRTLFDEAYRRGKGIILISGHYGNWELVAYAGSIILGPSFLIVVHPLKNPLIDRILNHYRTKAGNQVIPMGKAAKPIFSTIRKGGIIALLVDQSATFDKDVFVDFFGRPASTYEAPASLALKFDVPIITGFCERQKNGTYLVKLNEIKHDDLQNNPDGILELTSRHVKSLEDQIRKKPGQWAWQHRRWKHSHLAK